MEAAWERVLSPSYSWSSRCHLPSSCPCSRDLKAALTAQDALPLLEASKGPIQASDQGQGADRARDKGKGKGSKPPSDAKDAAKAKEVEAKAKEAEAKIKEADPKTKDASTSQPSQKEDLSPPKAKAQDFGFSCSFLL